MFNEAFWFFYWVSVVASLSVFFTVMGAITGIIGLFLKGCHVFDNEEECKRPAKYFLVIALICTIGVIFTPPEEALYAGAGQYVAESVELDDTLLKLKNVIDEKIDALSEGGE